MADAPEERIRVRFATGAYDLTEESLRSTSCAELTSYEEALSFAEQVLASPTRHSRRTGRPFGYRSRERYAVATMWIVLCAARCCQHMTPYSYVVGGISRSCVLASQRGAGASPRRSIWTDLLQH